MAGKDKPEVKKPPKPTVPPKPGLGPAKEPPKDR